LGLFGIGTNIEPFFDGGKIGSDSACYGQWRSDLHNAVHLDQCPGLRFQSVEVALQFSELLMVGSVGFPVRVNIAGLPLLKTLHAN